MQGGIVSPALLQKTNGNPPKTGKVDFPAPHGASGFPAALQLMQLIRGIARDACAIMLCLALASSPTHAAALPSLSQGVSGLVSSVGVM